MAENATAFWLRRMREEILATEHERLLSDEAIERGLAVLEEAMEVNPYGECYKSDIVDIIKAAIGEPES